MTFFLGLLSVALAIVWVAIVVWIAFTTPRAPGAIPRAIIRDSWKATEQIEPLTRAIVFVVAAGVVGSFVYWTLFHVAIANYFQNARLRRQAIAFLAVCFALGAAGRAAQLATLLVPKEITRVALQHTINILHSCVVCGGYLLINDRTIQTIRLAATTTATDSRDWQGLLLDEEAHG